MENKKEDSKEDNEENNEMEREKVELNWDEDHEEKKRGISELFKKIVMTGLSSPLLSEEQLKIYLSSLNLSRDMVTQVLKGVQKARTEIMQKVGGEFSKLVQKIDLAKEFKKTLSDHKISIRADIEFIPKNRNEKPETTTPSPSEESLSDQSSRES